MRTTLILKSPEDWRSRIRGNAYDEIRFYDIENLIPTEQRQAIAAAHLSVSYKSGKVLYGDSLIEIALDYQPVYVKEIFYEPV